VTKANSPGILHFACHNSFSNAQGSAITLDGGPWKPGDLSTAVQQLALATARPLVFLNACRSASEAAWFSTMSGWAGEFMRAGAGAFVGSLWAVRSSSARAFAEAFYTGFVDEARPLGEASLLARQAIAEDTGDPTWLAYTVYGNPAAFAARADDQ
jgi:CHAT domain-containing protein